MGKREGWGGDMSSDPHVIKPEDIKKKKLIEKDNGFIETDPGW